MTIIIQSNYEQLDLPLDVELSIETTSPLFSQASSMSLPISIPLTDHNKRVLNYPDILNIYDSKTKGLRPIQSLAVVVKHASWQQMATMDISSCSETAVEATIYFNESNIWSKIDEMTLPQAMAGLQYGNTPPTIDDISSYRENLFDALYDDYRTYPVSVDPREDEARQGELEYQEWVSMLTERAEWFQSREFVMAPIHTKDGWLNEIVTPIALKRREDSTYITAFLRLDYVLHKIFEKAGYSLEIDFDSFPDENEYSSHFEKQWHSILVLNNTMDALYPGCLYYSALVPDMSCKDFLLAVQAQFGCAFIFQPDGSYIMRFSESALQQSTGIRVSQFYDTQITFNSAPEYNPAENIENSEKAIMVYAKLPGTEYDNYYSSGHAGLDNYPSINTISLEGVCQRTSTTITGGEDSTKDEECPLIFVTMDFAIIYHELYNEYEQLVRVDTESYPAIRKPFVELIDPDAVVEDRDISRDLRHRYFYDIDGLYQIVNKSSLVAIESCDKVTITRMMSINEISSFNFAQPLIIKNRRCWPLKLQYKLKNTNKQQVTIELLAPHKL